MSVATEVLGTCGYEPYADGRTVRLRSCPFHALSEQNRQSEVCGLNHQLVQGIVWGLGSNQQPLHVSLAPLPNGHCVQLRLPGITDVPSVSGERSRRPHP